MKLDEETSTIIFGAFMTFFGILGLINLFNFITRDSELKLYRSVIKNLEGLISEQRVTIDKLYKEIKQDDIETN